MKLSQVKEYVTGVLKQWFTNKPILDKFNETETGELLYGTKAISSNPVLKYQKYLNTELDSCYCMLSEVYTPKAGEIVPFELSDGNMKVSNGKVTIKPGQRVQIDINLSFYNTASKIVNIRFEVQDITNSTLIAVLNTYDNAGTYEYNRSCCCQYENKTLQDCEIGLKVDVVHISDTMQSYNSQLTVQEIGRQIVIDPVEYINTEQGLEDTPVGHIISHMGIEAPNHYLVCDGAEYNIADYPHLAQHFIDNFDRVNRFGGDGIDTFCVPNELSQVAVINELTTEDLWTADSKYIFKEAGAFSVVGGRTYYKANAGKAIVAVARTTDGHTYPWLISTNQEYVTHYCSYNTSHISNDATTIEYLGLTWYCVRALYGFNESHTPSGFAVMVQCSTYSTNYAQVALEILKAASVTDTQPDAIPCIKYEPTYYMNVQNPLVGRSETVLFEGNIGNLEGVTDYNVPLKQSVKDFNVLGFFFSVAHSSYLRYIYKELPTEMLINFITNETVAENTIPFCWGYSDKNDYFDIRLGSTEDNLLVRAAYSQVTKIIGIKYQETKINGDTGDGETYTDEELQQAILDIVNQINTETVAEEPVMIASEIIEDEASEEIIPKIINEPETEIPEGEEEL